MGTFAGIGANTANKALLAKTKSAIKGGMDPEQARQQFGWFQDPTGDWKFEISDHKARLYQDKAGNWKLRHADLERAYPGMVKDLNISTMPSRNSLGEENPLMGVYLKDSNTAKLNESLLADPEEALRTLIHELQHGVQFREGFSPGTNPIADEVLHKVDTEKMPRWYEINERFDALRNQRANWETANKGKPLEDFYKLNPGWIDEHDRLLKERNSFPAYREMTHNMYESALGEVEARDTMNRLRLLPDDRKRHAPYRDNEVPGYPTWDMREVHNRLYPKKAADEPELRGLLTPEQKGMIGSLWGIGLFSDDAVAGLLAEPNRTRTTLGSNALWQLALLEMWLQKHDVG